MKKQSKKLKKSSKIIIKIDKDGVFPIDALSSLINTSKVSYYEIEYADKKAILKLYDKNKKLLKPY